MIFYAPGQEAAARTVNTEVGAPDDQVVEAPEDDPSWLRWGEGVDVMVILGPV